MRLCAVSLTKDLLSRDSGPHPLPPLPPSLRDYWVTALVDLKDPVVISSTRCSGYYINLGIRCAPDRLRSVVEREIRDGTVVWRETTSPEVSPEQLCDVAVRKRMTPVRDEGVWYRAGRLYFPAEDAS